MPRSFRVCAQSGGLDLGEESLPAFTCAQGVAQAFRESFEQALGWAEDGLWSSAASAFELLATGSAAGVFADRNRGLCCLWLADHDGAVTALRRYIARSKPTTDTVDLETLCQLIEPGSRYDLIDIDRLSWPIRNREGLLAALRGDRTIAQVEPRPLTDDPESPPLESFSLLDRPVVEAKPGLSGADLPCVEGELLIGNDVAYLEAVDDGRIDLLIDRFTSVAASNIPPAHPRTKIIGHVPRHELALAGRWHIPTGLAPEAQDRLGSERAAHVIGEIWPTTTHPSLRRRTPLQAGQAGDSETYLRASIRRMESTNDLPVEVLDWNELRLKLHLAPEPAIEPDTVEIDELHLSRLALVPIDRLDDERLLALYRRSVKWGLRQVRNQVSRLLDERPSLLTKGQVETIKFYGDLALDAAQSGERMQAEHWVAKGRESEPPQKRSAHSLTWDLIGLHVRMLLDPPEEWVPVLAVILDRCRGNQEMTSAVLLRLVQFGLVQAGVDPKRPDQLILDTRILEQYIKRYGPRVTTATGELGVAASQGEIWTPEAAGSSVVDLDSGLTGGAGSGRGKVETHPAGAVTPGELACGAMPVRSPVKGGAGLKESHRGAKGEHGLLSSARRRLKPPNRPLQPNRYFDSMRAIRRPDTVGVRKILREAKNTCDGGMACCRMHCGRTASLDTQTNSGL